MESNKEKGEKTITSVKIKDGNIQLHINKASIPALIDTGATLSCIREGIAQLLLKHDNYRLIHVNHRVYLADGTMKHLRKAVRFDFKIDKCRFTHTFTIMPAMQQPIILGTDFLSKAKSSISYTTDPTPEYQPTRARKSVTIPPFTEVALTAEVTCLYSVHNTVGITNNLQRNSTSPYIVQRSAVKPNELNRHPVVLFNITSKPIRIQKGEIVALFDTASIQSNNTPDTSPTYTSDSEDDQSTCSAEYTPAPSMCQDSGSEEEDEPTSSRERDREFFKLFGISNETGADDVTTTNPPILDNKQQRKLEQLLDKYKDVFVQKDGVLGSTPQYTHEIDLKPGAVPCHYYPFRQAPHKAELLENHCEALLKQDVLEETNTGPWASRSFLVEKKDGKQRLVTDFRYLNSWTINQALISPRADDSIEMIGNMKPAVFSKMDAQQGFFQIPLREADRDKTAFLTRTKKYRYKVMPMGLCSSSQAFQSLINLILQNLQYKCAIPYLDDILCLSPSIEQHFIDLEDIFIALRKGNLKLKSSKCEFFLKEMTFLGMIITPEGILPSPDKVSKVHSFPTPRTTKDVRSFTGLAQFYRKFIKNFSKIARPLFELQQKDADFIWTDECEEAFNKLKKALTEDVILQYPDYSKEFHLETDASAFSLGSTLSQYDKNNDLRPVAFGGRSLNIHEQNYSATQRELLGVVFAIESYRHYLEDRKFQLYTDHQPLISLLKKPDAKHMLSRWALKIQQFQYEVQHLKGKLNITADAMSRRTYDPDPTIESDPPPQPHKVKVARRVSFPEESVQTQTFDPESPPSKIHRGKTKVNLNKRSTHHIFCDCSDTGKPGNMQFLEAPIFKDIKPDQDKFTSRSKKSQPPQLMCISLNTDIWGDTLSDNLGTAQLKHLIVEDSAQCKDASIEITSATQQITSVTCNHKTTGIKPMSPTWDTDTHLPPDNSPAHHLHTAPDTSIFRPEDNHNNRPTENTIHVADNHPTPLDNTPAELIPPHRPLHANHTDMITHVSAPTPTPDAQQDAAPAYNPPHPHAISAINRDKTKDNSLQSEQQAPAQLIGKGDACNIAKHLKEQTSLLMDLMENLIDPNITLLNLKREQRQSTDLSLLMNYLEKDQLPDTKILRDKIYREAQDHIMFNGILMHVNNTLWKKHNEFLFQPVIPESMKQSILQHFHDIPLAGHSGTRKMISAMLPKVHWKHMPSDIEKYCATCNICLKAKKFNINPMSPMTKHTPVTSPFQFMHIDAIGPLPETPSKHKYIQVVVDRFSKYCIAYPTTSLDAETTAAEFLSNVILAHTVPAHLQSDNGTSYTGSKFRKMCSKFGIKHILSSAYRPKSNGQAERYVQTISTGIRSYCMDNQKSWDVYLPFVVYSMNSMQNDTTQYSPFFMIHGYQPNTIIDNAFQNRPEAVSVQQHVIDKLVALDYTYKRAEMNISKSTDSNKQLHDRKSKESPVRDGSLVYVKVPRLLDRSKCLKLQHAFSGPYVVCAHKSPTSVILKSIDTMKLAAKPVHIDRLKLVHHVRNNPYLKRLIGPNCDLIAKLWKTDGHSITPTKRLLETAPKIIYTRSFSKIQKITNKGLKSRN